MWAAESSGMCQTWARRVACRTVASRVRQASGAVGGDRAGQQAGVRPVDEMEGAVAGEQEGVARLGRLRESGHGLGPRCVEASDAEVAVQGGHGVAHREVVQQAVDGADPERVAGRVDQEDQAVVPGAGEGCSRGACDRSPSGGGRRR